MFFNAMRFKDFRCFHHISPHTQANAVGSPLNDNCQRLYIPIPCMKLISDRAVVWSLFLGDSITLSNSQFPALSLCYTRVTASETTWLLMIMEQVELWLHGLWELLWSLTDRYYSLSVTQNLQTHKFPVPAHNDSDSLALPTVLLSALQELVWVICRNSRAAEVPFQSQSVYIPHNIFSSAVPGL